MKFKPVGTRVVLEPIVIEHKSPSGIILSEAKLEKTDRLKVMAIGSEVKEVMIGDVVLVEPHRGSPFNVEGGDYVLVYENEIMGVF